MKRANNIAQMLRGGHVALGLMVTELRTPQVGAMLAAAQYDFAIIDMEHGSYSYETVADMILGCHGAGVTPFVRVPEIRQDSFTKVLDAGAQGVLVPSVQHAKEAELAVGFAKYAPIGERGVSLRKAHAGFSPPGRVEYTRFANEQTMVMIQIETETGLNNIEELVHVDGIDLIFIGPADLAHSLSPTDDTHEREQVEQAIRRILDVSKKCNRRIGIHMADPERAKSLVRAGVQFITIGTDVSMFIDACQTKRIEIRGATETGRSS